MTERKEHEKEQTVQTLDRTLDIIELLSTSHQGMGVTEIGQKLNLHKSTVFRLLNALLRRGYAEKDPKKGLYRIGLKFIEISSLRMHQLELKTEASPFMRHLAETTGQVTHLALLDGADVVYIEKIDVVQSLRLYSQIGRRIPVYCSALGKALLSGQSRERLLQVLEGIGFETFTENTITDPETLLEEVDKVRERGWASDNEEHERGIRCIAAPVKDFTGKIIAALSISGDRNALRPSLDARHARMVMEAAEGISVRMGFSSE